MKQETRKNVEILKGEKKKNYVVLPLELLQSTALLIKMYSS